MAISFTCTCGKRLKVKDELAGKKVRCPDCGGLTVAQAQAEPTTEPLRDGETIRSKQENFDTVKSPKKMTKTPVSEEEDDDTVKSSKKLGKKPVPDDEDDEPRSTSRKGRWSVGGEVMAPLTPDCLSLGTIKKLSGDKALIDFPQSDYSGWVFVRTLEPVELYEDLEVKCTDRNGSIRDGKILNIQGKKVRVVYGFSMGVGQPVEWTDEQGLLDVKAIGVPCPATSPGAKPAGEFEFYENLAAGDRVWAPWESTNLYAGKVSQVKEHEVLIDFDNGNKGWVLMGQILPFATRIGERIGVRKKAGGPIVGATIEETDGKRIQVEYEDGGKKAWVTSAVLVMSRVLPIGPDPRPTKIVGGTLLRVFSKLVGVLLLVLAAGLLWWNEDQAAKRAAGLAQGVSACIPASKDKLDPANEGKLIHLAGDAATSETLADDIFPEVKTKALKLVRTVEIYQWVERSETKTEKTTKTTVYHHEAKWVKEPVKSDGFHVDVNNKKPINKGEKSIKDNLVRAQEVKIGAYKLTDAQVDRIGKAEKLPILDEAAAKTDQWPSNRVKVLDGLVYITTDPTDPKVGDLRITFSEVKPQAVSVIAQQSSGSFAPWQPPGGGSVVDELRSGIVSMDDMFKKAEESHKLMQLILRIAGGVVVFLGVYMFAVHAWLWRKFRPQKIGA